MQADHDTTPGDDLIDEDGYLRVEALELLPPGKYAILMFLRWETELYPGEGAKTARGSDDTFDMEWMEAVADGSALIMPNLDPSQLPAAYEVMANCVEFGAAIVGHEFSSDDEFEAFAGVFGRHVVTMDDLLRVQQGGACDVKH